MKIAVVDSNYWEIHNILPFNFYILISWPREPRYQPPDPTPVGSNIQNFQISVKIILNDSIYRYIHK